MTSDRDPFSDGIDFPDDDDAAVESLLRGELGSQTPLGACLAVLRAEATGTAPTPSAELAALLAGGPDELAARRNGARRPVTAATVVVAACGVLGVSGVAAAHDALPGPVQKVVTEIVEHTTPFTVGAPASTPRQRDTTRDVAPTDLPSAADPTTEFAQQRTAPATGRPSTGAAGSVPVRADVAAGHRATDPGRHRPHGTLPSDGTARESSDRHAGVTGPGDHGSDGHGSDGHGSGGRGAAGHHVDGRGSGDTADRTHVGSHGRSFDHGGSRPGGPGPSGDERHGDGARRR